MSLAAPSGRIALAVLLTAAGALAARTEGPQRSPEVAADGRLTFRLHAPGAESASVVVEGEAPAAMARGEAGVWSLTTDPLAPDLYGYFYVVDGLPRSDPLNPLGKPVVTGGELSIVHVPGPATLVWETGDGPRGAVDRHVYESAAIGEQREYYVYTPPGYDPAADRRYPVLYLLHGVGDDATAWRTAGRFDVIMDNLIGRGEAEPMLVVTPLGYGFTEPAHRLWQVVGSPPELLTSQDAFAAALIDEILPRVEAEYRAVPEREARAIAGLSMGGSQALYVGLHHLDRFAWIGSFSGALMMFYQGYDKAFAGIEDGAGDRLRLLWLSCGEADFLIGVNRQFRDWLAANGLPFTWTEGGGGHTWMVWRRNLEDFARLLFRAAPVE